MASRLVPADHLNVDLVLDDDDTDMPSTATASPVGAGHSKIPLPLSKISTAAQDPHPSAHQGQGPPPSRIPKAVSPERLTPSAEVSQGSGKKSPFVQGGDSVGATFVRRLSPPALSGKTLRNDGADGKTWTKNKRRFSEERPADYVVPISIDLDEELAAKVEQMRRRDYENSQAEDDRRIRQPSAAVMSPSRIPVAAEYLGIKSHSSSSSSSTRVSPVRQTSPPRKLMGGRERSRSTELVGHESVVSSSTRQRISSSGLESSSESNCSKIPLPRSCRSSPARNVPTVGWSFSPERMLAAEGDKVKGAENNGRADTTVKKGKMCEAFVMTGDRMINLAKTPANTEFKSKHHKLTEPSAADQNWTNEPSVARRALVRNSKSEEQLLDANPDELDQDLPLEDVSGSANTLLGTSGLEALEPEESPPPRPTQPKPQQQLKQDRHQQQLVLETMGSPETENHSLLGSMSEQYNAESVLKMSASQSSSSSPDTPEWSLLESYHKNNNNGEHNRPFPPYPGERGADESSSCGNRVVISIGDKERQLSSGTGASPSRNGATTAMLDNNDDDDEESPYATPIDSLSSPSHPLPPLAHLSGNHQSPSPSSQSASQRNSIVSNNSSEDESDMDSLHSYHPPVKVVDVPSAVRLAKRLYALDGFKKTDISRHLSKNTDYNHVVAEKYLKFFDFDGLSLDAALRTFLGHFCLTGETQERERVLAHFSRRYLECNPRQWRFRSHDAAHTLTCAIMLLNSDLHGDGVTSRRKMTCAEFVENLAELNDGADFDRDLLRAIYVNIRDKPIPWADADERRGASDGGESQSGSNSVTRESDSQEQVRQKQMQQSMNLGSDAGGYNPFLTLPAAVGAEGGQASVEYKTGYVMRKSCCDAGGKKTKMGKRSWRMFFVSLHDLVLYCFRDEKSARAPGALADPRAAIRVHHALAVRAADYTKKQFVFRLHTADRAQYLFQTVDEKELLKWIDALNHVVASLSSPQLPAAVSSSTTFERPLLPSGRSRLSAEEQQVSHEKQLRQLRQELETVLEEDTAASAASGGRRKHQNMLAVQKRLEYLRFEIMRYETYVLTLRTKTSN